MGSENTYRDSITDIIVKSDKNPTIFRDGNDANSSTSTIVKKSPMMNNKIDTRKRLFGL